MSNKSAKSGSVRLIGGQFKGRKIQFRTAPGLRPTPSRVRETLFNWLRPHLAGATCLDAFAGTGALGFEALSHGSKQCTFVDRSRSACAMLRENASRIQCENLCSIHCADALPWLSNEHRWDIIFLDPPFASQALSDNALRLAFSQQSPAAFIYVESAHSTMAALTEFLGPREYRSTVAGEVEARLYEN